MDDVVLDFASFADPILLLGGGVDVRWFVNRNET